MTATGRPAERPDGPPTGPARAGRGLPSGVLYQLQVRTFTPDGTFAAAIDRLPHLVDLGVDLVELLPVDTAHGLAAFVDACHARGLGVILHVGYEHLDPRSDDAQQMVLTSVGRWLREHDVDGLRVPLRGGVVDPAATRLFAQLVAEVTILSVQLGRPLSLIVGSDVDTARLVVPSAPASAGARAGQEAADSGHFASLESVADVLVRRFAADPLRHDAGATAPRAGDPITATLSAGLRRVAATLLLTGPAIPILAMGEEWGGVHTGPVERRPAPEPALATAGRPGRFATRGWWDAAMGDPATAAPAPLDWSEREQPPHRELLRLYRRLIALRRQEPQLAAACAWDTDVRKGDHFLAVRRGGCVVVANLGRTPRRVNVAGVPRRVLLATEPGVSLTHDSVDLPPESAAVVVCHRFDQD